VIVDLLRPLLLGPVAAAWKQMEAPQVRQCRPHRGQEVAEHDEDPIAVTADVQRRLFDAPSLECL
jgi:hypothetical protein